MRAAMRMGIPEGGYEEKKKAKGKNAQKGRRGFRVRAHSMKTRAPRAHDYAYEGKGAGDRHNSSQDGNQKYETWEEKGEKGAQSA